MMESGEHENGIQASHMDGWIAWEHEERGGRSLDTILRKTLPTIGFLSIVLKYLMSSLDYIAVLRSLFPHGHVDGWILPRGGRPRLRHPRR